jgi:cellulose synthase/poly-beta-1,6-N-acetylglucosamine synthase-like glycosyltransferase
VKRISVALQKPSEVMAALEADSSALTVGICANTEVDSTVRLVNSSLNGPNGQNTKVLVVTPNENLARILDGRDTRVRVIKEENRDGKTVAMNRLLGNIPRGIVVYASADIEVNDGAVNAIAKELARTPETGALIARVRTVNEGEGVMGLVGSLLWGLFNAISKDMEVRKELAQANDLYAFRRELIGSIPEGTINDDTFIATTIRRKGYLVRVAEVNVAISGPRRPLEYIAQRSRIIMGHLQTIRRQKVLPTVFEFSILMSPYRCLDVLARTLAARGTRVLGIAIVAAELELISWLGALTLSVLRKDVSSWRPVLGTKDLRGSKLGLRSE